MERLKISINDTQIDISEDERSKVAISYSIGDINELGARDSSKSKTLTIPATPNNKLLFGFSEDINSANTFDQTEKPTAEIELDGVPLISGYMKMMSATRDGDGKFSEYEVAIIGDNGEWQQRANYLKLTDLDYSAQDHVWNETNVTNSELITSGIDYVYPLIQYGNFTPNANPHYVDVEDRYPAINVKSIITKILNGQGYRITSDFIDSAFFEALYIPFTSDMIKNTEAWKTARMFRAGITAASTCIAFGHIPYNNPTTFHAYIPYDDDTSTGNFDNSGVFNTGASLNKWTVDVDQNTRIEAGMNFNLLYQYATGATLTSANITTVTLHIKVNGVSVASVTEAINNPSTIAPGGTSTTTQTITVKTDYLRLNAGDIVKAYAEVHAFIGYSKTPISVRLNITNDSETYFANDPSYDMRKGSTIRLSETLPSMTQLEFIQALKDEFNLYFYTDVGSRTVYIEPRDDFYTGETLDWSNKLDVGDKWNISYIGDNLSKRISFKYKKDSADKLIDEFEKSQLNVDGEKYIFGSQIEEIDNVFSKDATNSFINSGFAPTIMGDDFIEGMLIPQLYSELPTNRKKTTAFATRILYYAGRALMPTGKTWLFEATTKTVYPNMYFYDEVNSNDNSLLFNDTSTGNGLVQKYYRNTLKIINESRVVTAMFNLDALDIANLDFRKIIYIETEGNGAYYYLNSINSYKPLVKQTTEVELIKLVGQLPRRAITYQTVKLPNKRASKSGGIQANLPPSGGNPNDNLDMGRGNRNLGSGGLTAGQFLESNGDNQMVMGQHNVGNATAKLIIGGGNAGEKKNILLVDEEGNFAVGGGYVTTTISDLTYETYYTDASGKSQKITID